MPDCQMTAIGLSRRPAVGEFEQVLESLTLPQPKLGPGQVRVQVRASAVNIDDRHFAEGTMFGGIPTGRRPRPGDPVVPGLDLAGVVEAVGARVQGFAVGDEVFGVSDMLSRRGSWSTHTCVSAKNLHHKPPAWSWAEAAAIGISSLVALALVRAAEPVAGCRVVIVGASGGIGGVVTQILARRDVEVIGVCSGSNAELVRSLGAGRVVDYHRGGFGEQLAGEGVRVDRVLDLVGGRATEAEAMKVLDAQGRFLTAVGPHAFVGERKLGLGELLGMFAYMLGRSVAGRVRGPRWQLVGGQGMDWALFERLVLDGGVRPSVDRCFPLTLAGVREANTLVASHRARGKVILEAPSPTSP